MSLSATNDPVVESVRIPAGAFDLEGELAYAETGWPVGGAVIAGPHPLLGGTMHNNVVRGLADGLARRGLVVLRFNYRCVGHSDGPRTDMLASLAAFWATSHVPEEPGYRADLQFATRFLQEVLGSERPPALIGYSFGCSLLPCAAPPSVPLALIAPTIEAHDYSEFRALANPLLVIASEDDFAAEGSRCQEWAESLPRPVTVVRGMFDNHFFRGHEDRLVETVFDFLEAQGRVSQCA